MICKYFLPSLRLFFYSDHCVLWLLTLFWMVSLEDYLQKWYKAYVESWQKNQSPVIRTDTQGQGLYEGVDAEPQGRGMLRGWRHNVFLLRVHICHWDWARHKATDGGQVIPGGHPRWLSGKQSACQCRRWEFISWVGKIHFLPQYNPLQYSCLENPMDRGAWWAAHTHTHTHTHTPDPRSGKRRDTRTETYLSLFYWVIYRRPKDSFISSLRGLNHYSSDKKYLG